MFKKKKKLKEVAIAKRLEKERFDEKRKAEFLKGCMSIEDTCDIAYEDQICNPDDMDDLGNGNQKSVDNVDNDNVERKGSLAKNKNRKKKKKRRKRNLLQSIIIICVILFVAYKIMNMNYFNIKSVEVSGNSNISKEQIIKESGIKLGANLFFINKSRIEKNLKENPYYSKIEISRKLPDKVQIDITEREDKTVLPYGEKFIVLDKEGVVLKLEKERPQLTKVNNVQIKNMDRGKVVQAKDEENLRRSLELISASEKNDIFFKEVGIFKDEVAVNLYKSLYLDGEYSQVLKHIKNGNIKKIIQDLHSKNIERGTIKVGTDDYLSFTPTFD